MKKLQSPIFYVLAVSALALSSGKLRAQALPPGDIFVLGDTSIQNLSGTGPNGPYTSSLDSGLNAEVSLFAFNSSTNAVPAAPDSNLYTFTVGTPWDVGFYFNTDVDGLGDGPDLSNDTFFLELDTNPGLTKNFDDIDPLSNPGNVSIGAATWGTIDYAATVPTAPIDIPGTYAVWAGISDPTEGTQVFDFINVKVIQPSVPEVSSTLLLLICAMVGMVGFDRYRADASPRIACFLTL